MPCHCGERRSQLGRAAKAVQTGRYGVAIGETGAAAKSLSDDAKAFARGLKERLAKR